MMVPIAGAMFEAIGKVTGTSSPGLKKAVYLGIAYASSTGGLTTLTGSLSLVRPVRCHVTLTLHCRHGPQPHHGGATHHNVPQGAAHILHPVVHVSRSVLQLVSRVIDVSRVIVGCASLQRCN